MRLDRVDLVGSSSSARFAQDCVLSALHCELRVSTIHECTKVHPPVWRSSETGLGKAGRYKRYRLWPGCHEFVNVGYLWQPKPACGESAIPVRAHSRLFLRVHPRSGIRLFSTSSRPKHHRLPIRSNLRKKAEAPVFEFFVLSDRGFCSSN